MWDKGNLGNILWLSCVVGDTLELPLLYRGSEKGEGGHFSRALAVMDERMLSRGEMSHDWGDITEKQQETGQLGKLTGARGGLAKAESCLDSDNAHTA